MQPDGNRLLARTAPKLLWLQNQSEVDTRMLVVFTIEPLVAVTVTKPFKAGAAATVRFSAKLKVFDDLSVTVTVNGFKPATVGVPERTPLDALRLNPAGKTPVLDVPVSME